MARSPLQLPGMISENNEQVRKRARKLGVVQEYWRPRTRADCATFARPCPYLGCRYNLSLHVSQSGGLRWQEDLPQDTTNCALDVADEGPHNLDDIGEMLGLGREWARNGLLTGLAALKDKF